MFTALAALTDSIPSTHVGSSRQSVNPVPFTDLSRQNFHIQKINLKIIKKAHLAVHIYNLRNPAVDVEVGQSL